VEVLTTNGSIAVIVQTHQLMKHMIPAKQSAISYQQLSFYMVLHLRRVKAKKSMQSVACKDQKNSTFPPDIPLSNAMVINHIIAA